MDGERLLPLRVLSPSAQRVQDALAAGGFSCRVRELDLPVRTAADAARAVGCEVGQIAKCVMFRAAQAAAPVAFVDEDLLKHGTIWAAAGHPNSLFRLDPADLPRMTGGRVVRMP